MNEPDGFQQCVIASQFIGPRLSSVEKGLDSAHAKLREHVELIVQLKLLVEDAKRRQDQQEAITRELHLDSGRLHKDMAEMKAQVSEIMATVRGVASEVSALTKGFREHGIVAEEAVRAATRRSLYLWLVLTGILGTLLVMHGVFTGVPVIESLRAFFKIGVPAP